MGYMETALNWAAKPPIQVCRKNWSVSNGDTVTENAQKLEEKRLTFYNEIAAQNEALGLGSNKLVSLCVNPTGSFNSAVYAYGRVIVHVTSKLVSLCVNQQLFDFLPDEREIYVNMLSPPSHEK
ncbi:hypothetical protein T459_11271 [Capsicum annuum]|uniref:Uncharacterized protein n=1 Tax=Capsicum annuum TaxID=4072 RepID=A0A2G2ZLF0_CAPAN|nr:hypothetical protein T459_11271 [Capsicum annuum]